jgi:hypothetical protein
MLKYSVFAAVNAAALPFWPVAKSTVLLSVRLLAVVWLSARVLVVSLSDHHDTRLVVPGLDGALLAAALPPIADKHSNAKITTLKAIY